MHWPFSLNAELVKPFCFGQHNSREQQGNGRRARAVHADVEAHHAARRHVDGERKPWPSQWTARKIIDHEKVGLGMVNLHDVERVADDKVSGRRIGAHAFERLRFAMSCPPPCNGAAARRVRTALRTSSTYFKREIGEGMGKLALLRQPYVEDVIDDRLRAAAQLALSALWAALAPLHRAGYRIGKKAPSQTIDSRPMHVKQFRGLLRLLKWQRPGPQRAKHAGDGCLPLSIVLWFGH
ncbi:hypothetical protein BURK_008146 [Burkholderia sp. SJ98]|nr:hypothetical protein BURK_008146 [Burkholderia sp. SJ98]